MNKEWFNAQELAGVAGMTSTKSGNIRKLARLKVPSRPRQAQGGGLEYHINSLPYATQQALRARAIDAAPAADANTITPSQFLAADIEQQKRDAHARRQARADSLAKFAALPSEKKDRARAKEWLIHECDKFIKAHGLKKMEGVETFCADFNRRKITLPTRFNSHLTSLHGQQHLHPSTLREWERKYHDTGLNALVDNYGARKGQSKIERTPLLKKVVLGCLFDTPHITAKKILQYIKAAYPELAIVSVKSLERYITGWKHENAELWAYTTNPDLWKNRFMPAFGSHHQQIERLNQLWELDSTPADVMLIDGRHSIVGVIDMYTRRMKLLVSKSSTAAAVCQVFRKAVIAWGVPEAIRTDNGKDYVSEQFTSVIRALEIPQHLCIPFASEEKGTIERALQTMSHGLLDLLPGFIGHNVAERKVIEARKSFSQRIMQADEVVEISLSSEDLQQKLDQWTDHIYMHDEHGGLQGKTPWQVATSWTGTINRISNERALDMLLAEVAGIRTIGKKGIALDRHHYFSADAGFRVGMEVQLRRDESDIGRVYVYSINGEFITIAECPILLGISPAEAANAAKSAAKKLLTAQKQEFKQNRAYVKGNISEVVIQHRIEASQNVTALPHKSTEYNTAALSAAGDAAQHQQHNKHLRNPQAAPGLTEQEQQLQREIAETMRQPAPVIELHQSPEDRYARAYHLERREHLNASQQQWLKAYQSGSEYSAMRDYHEDFGITPEWSEAK